MLNIDALTEDLTFHTHRFPGVACTVAIAVMPDGFVAGFGKSTCIYPATFSNDGACGIAIEYARRDAVNRLREMEEYRLKQAAKQNTL
ncbi:hypothetical protein I4Z10_002526 [Salmonella enterica subsp. enterica serovar Infantis]|nr:hypothetical protein [Salmonella enterica subsp. enterica serovar Newport]EGR7980900.1 hypothetical protein [Salmonella enterica subsp. enterica serovar Infantis]